MNDTKPRPRARGGTRRNDTETAPEAAPDTGTNGVKTFTVRADRGRQAVLKTLQEHCGTVTTSGAMWMALEGYVAAVEALASSRQREAAIRRQLREVLDAATVVAEANATQDAIQGRARELVDGSMGGDFMDCLASPGR